MKEYRYERGRLLMGLFGMQIFYMSIDIVREWKVIARFDPELSLTLSIGQYNSIGILGFEVCLINMNANAVENYKALHIQVARKSWIIYG